MKQFQSIEKLDTAILYALELASSISVLLLAFGLIASMANVLTKGSVLTGNPIMQRIWAWTQCIAIDASVAGTIIRTFRYYTAGEKVRTWIYGLLSALLLFTAAIVSNIESLQQTLNLTLDAAYLHVFVPVEALIWIRSIAIVLLIVAHALRHVQLERTKNQDLAVSQPVPSLVLAPELIETLRVLLWQTTVSEETPNTSALSSSGGEQGANNSLEASEGDEGEQEANNYERVKAHMATFPTAKVRDVAGALSISVSTANKWMNRVKGKGEQDDQKGM
jgi:hypothetical protein